MDPGSGAMEWKLTLHGTYGPNMNAFCQVVVEIYEFLKNLKVP